MTRRHLLALLSAQARQAGVSFRLIRHGGQHDIYRLDELTVVIPRHREINEHTARGILAEVAHRLRRTP